MASKTQFSVNLPLEARRMWDMKKRGHSHTRVAMAGLAAFACLGRDTQDELMTLVATIHEQGRPWDEVLAWADARREANGEARSNSFKISSLPSQAHQA